MRRTVRREPAGVAEFGQTLVDDGAVGHAAVPQPGRLAPVGIEARGRRGGGQQRLQARRVRVLPDGLGVQLQMALDPGDAPTPVRQLAHLREARGRVRDSRRVRRQTVRGLILR
jgi:hypothetical protein